MAIPLVNKEMLNHLYKEDRLEWFLNGRYLRVNEMNGDIGNLDYQNYPVALNTFYEMYNSKKYPNIENIFEDKLFLLLNKKCYNGMLSRVDVYCAMNYIYLQLKNERNHRAPFQLKHPTELLEKLRNVIRENKYDFQSFTTNTGTNMYDDMVWLNKQMIENHLPSVIDKDKHIWQPWRYI